MEPVQVAGSRPNLTHVYSPIYVLQQSLNRFPLNAQTAPNADFRSATIPHPPGSPPRPAGDTPQGIQ
jgi:hypothetical protein